MVCPRKNVYFRYMVKWFFFIHNLLILFSYIASPLQFSPTSTFVSLLPQIHSSAIALQKRAALQGY